MLEAAGAGTIGCARRVSRVFAVAASGLGTLGALRKRAGAGGPYMLGQAQVGTLAWWGWRAQERLGAQEE